MKRLGIALSAIIVIAALGATTAGAINSSRTSITIQRSPDFHGTVQSDPQCQIDRPVVLKKEKSGFDKTVGHDRADADGSWVITPQPLQQGDYYAKAKRTVLEDGHICKRGVSQTIQIGPGV
jgi:hypothetical protein